MFEKTSTSPEREHAVGGPVAGQGEFSTAEVRRSRTTGAGGGGY